MRIRVISEVLFSFCLFACSTKTTIQEVRHPLIQFSYDSLSWTDDSYGFSTPIRVISYPLGPMQPGKIYNRFTLQATGRDSKGRSLQFNILFDASDSTELVGLYQLNYTAEKGLAQVELLNFDNNNPYYYLLCTDDSSSLLQIQKQSLTEHLVTGIFQFTICNASDSTQKIKISNGIMTDIHY